MNRKPDIEETNDVAGEVHCTFKVWIEPCDFTWDQLVDTDVHGETPPEGTEVWDVCVSASIECGDDGEHFKFEGLSSLGGIICDQTKQSDDYLKQCVTDVKREAYRMLLVDIQAAADGEGMRKEELRVACAMDLLKP